MTRTRRTTASLAVAALLALAPALRPASAATYYVNNAGSDANSGTSPGAAWQTEAAVNAHVFAPGDGVLFAAGQTFTGNLVFDAADAGTQNARVTIGSYGAGRATLTATAGTVLEIKNAGGFRIQDLVLVGPGRLNAAGAYGLLLHCDTAGGEKYDYVDVLDVETRENHEAGIYVESTDASDPGFRHVLVQGCDVHDNGRNGMVTQGVFHTAAGDPFTPHADLTVRDCQFHDNTGLSGQPSHSGSGIIVSGVDGGLIEYCTATNNGALNDAPGGGPVGIWCWEAKNLVFQHNESHHNLTQGGDGGGFDIDGGSMNCVMQYNYSHDNLGSGFGLYQFQGAHTYTGNVVRYNVTQNDRNSGIQTWGTNSSGGLQTVLIYNNTVYVGATQLGAAMEDLDVHKDFVFNQKVYNNLFVGAAGKPLISIPHPANGWDFRGNCYHSYGSGVTLSWNHANYASLAAFRAASGQETGTGFEVDPGLANAGGGGTVGDPHLLPALTAYALTGASPLIDHGLDLGALLGIDTGGHDFCGAATPTGAGYDVGAEEYQAGLVGVPDAGPGGARGLALAAGSPNPFADATSVRFVLPRAGRVALAIFDARGARVRTLVDGALDAGTHARAWDGRRDDGTAAPLGLYFVRLDAGGETARGKLVRTR